MPELPEVEFCRRALARWTRDRTVVGTDVLDPRVVRLTRTARPSAGRDDGAAALEAVCTGRRPGALERHGKRLLWRFGDDALLLHLGMTGKWTREVGGAAAPRHAKVRLSLDDGSAISFVDPRLLGGIVPTTGAEGAHMLHEGLGPDALGAPLPPLRGARPVKLALMDQSFVAGLGNVQVMEALWRAGVHPATRCDGLSNAQRARLSEAVQDTLADTLAMLGDGDDITYVEESLASNPFAIYRREGKPCPSCGTPIARLVQGGRSTYWCPACQA